LNFHSIEFLDIGFLTLTGSIFSVIILLAIVIAKESNLDAIGISIQTAYSIAILLFGLSWLISNNYFQHNFEQFYKLEHQSTSYKQKILINIIHEKIKSTYSLAESLSKNDSLQTILEKSNTQALKTDDLKQVNLSLKQSVGQSKSNSILLINANGYCIASNDKDSDFSLIGTNFSKNDFFDQGNAKIKTLTYWQESRKGSSGLLIAYPVSLNGKYIGASYPNLMI
jgi:C4-dicarboxylate-specific signal transduction histidine kinase